MSVGSFLVPLYLSEASFDLELEIVEVGSLVGLELEIDEVSCPSSHFAVERLADRTFAFHLVVLQLASAIAGTEQP